MGNKARVLIANQVAITTDTLLAVQQAARKKGDMLHCLYILTIECYLY